MHDEMPTSTVYEYERYSCETRSFHVAKMLATEQTINSFGGIVRYSTAAKVPAALVDQHGFCERQRVIRKVKRR